MPYISPFATLQAMKKLETVGLGMFSALAAPATPRDQRQAGSLTALTPGGPLKTTKHCFASPAAPSVHKSPVPCRVTSGPAELAVPSWATGSSSLGSTLVSAKSFRVYEVPGDGNCLFAAMAVCKMMAEGKRLGVEDVKSHKEWGRRNRAEQIKAVRTRLEAKANFPTADGPPLETCIQVSTDMTGTEYCNLSLI